MPWITNRIFKIRFLKQGKNSEDHTIQFEIADTGRIEFYKEIEYFLASCINADAFIAKCESIIDDSGEATELEIEISGSQGKLMQVLNQHGPELSKHSVSFK